MSDHYPPRPPGSGPYPGFGPGGSGPPPPPPAPGAYVPPPIPVVYGQVMAPYGAYQPAKSTNGFAIASMVIGIVSSLACYLGIFTGVLGLVLGLVALSQIRAAPERIGGKGMAIAGIVTSTIAIVIWVGLIVLIGLLDQ